MNLFEEYALLVVVCAPVLVVVFMNLWLAWNGEKETLLLPGTRKLPPVDLGAGESLAAQPAASRPAIVEPVREAA